MIEAEALTRRYGETLAVDDVSFAIGAGEIVGLLGHNGAGKTTIMKMLTGYLEPSAGTARVAGLDVAEAPAAARRQIGYLPENCPVYPEMAVVDYLDYVADLRGVDGGSGALAEVLEATDLAGRAFDAIGTLSRGYQQRVGVAQAIIHKPRFLILDEPTNGLDPAQTQHMRELIRRLATAATVILSTHIMQEVDAVCDRVIILRGGELALDERLDALKQGGRMLLATAAGETEVSAALGDFATAAPVGDGFAVTFAESESGGAQAAELARRLVAAQIPIHSLAPEKRDLEAVFREVTAGGAPAASEVAP